MADNLLCQSVSWLMTLPDAKYQRCAPPDHIAAGTTLTDERPIRAHPYLEGWNWLKAREMYRSTSTVAIIPYAFPTTCRCCGFCVTSIFSREKSSEEPIFVGFCDSVISPGFLGIPGSLS